MKLLLASHNAKKLRELVALLEGHAVQVAIPSDIGGLPEVVEDQATFRANAAKYPDYRFYPCMPYAHKYANAVTEHGMIEALRMFLPQDGAVSAMLKGGIALASKDIDAIMELLIDAEMKMFHGLNTPVIFMQNVITDLLLGLGMKQCFRTFHDHVRKRTDSSRALLHHGLGCSPSPSPLTGA